MSIWSRVVLFFFFKQKTAYEMRISDWSSDVCSSDLVDVLPFGATFVGNDAGGGEAPRARDDLESFGGAIGADENRHDDAALAHGRQYVGHVGGLPGIAHIGLADGQLAKFDELEFHNTHLFEGAVRKSVG